MSVVPIKDLIGIPYKVHGRDLDGFDCYGLVIYVLKTKGIILPDVFYSDVESETKGNVVKEIFTGLPIIKLDSPENYCVIFLRVKGQATHCGVYLGKGQFIHCTKDLGVCIDNVRRWERNIVGFYKVKE